MRPAGHDPATESAEMAAAIDQVNDEMVAAGVRVYVGGLQDPGLAKTLRPSAGGVEQADGPFKDGDYCCGLWVLDVASQEEALEWGRKAALACQATIEVRQFL
jgi:hypothetical protein